MIYLPTTEESSPFFILSMGILFIAPIPLLIIIYIKGEIKWQGIVDELERRQDCEGLFNIGFLFSMERIRANFAVYIHIIITGVIYVAFIAFTVILIYFFSQME